MGWIGSHAYQGYPHPSTRANHGTPSAAQGGYGNSEASSDVLAAVGDAHTQYIKWLAA